MTRPMGCRRKAMISGLLLSGLFFPAAAARAAVTTTYAGSGCSVTETTSQGSVTRANGILTANAKVDVVCPVTKTTTAVVWTGSDGIYQMSINQTSPHVGDVSCKLATYLSSVGYPNEPPNYNLLNEDVVTSTSTGTHTLVKATADFESWWDATNSDFDAWLYANVICTLKAGAKLTSYSISEHGAQQTHTRIYSTAGCVPTTTSSYAYFEGFSGQTGGYWEHLQANALTVNCPIPADSWGRWVDVSLGPSFSPDGDWICRIDNGDNQWSQPNSPLSEWPSQVLTFNIPAGAHTLHCFSTGNFEGDSKILSYRSYSP